MDAPITRQSRIKFLALTLAFVLAIVHLEISYALELLWPGVSLLIIVGIGCLRWRFGPRCNAALCVATTCIALQIWCVLAPENFFGFKTLVQTPRFSNRAYALGIPQSNEYSGLCVLEWHWVEGHVGVVMYPLAPLWLPVSVAIASIMSSLVWASRKKLPAAFPVILPSP